MVNKSILLLTISFIAGFLAWGNPGTTGEYDALIDNGKYHECIGLLKADLPQASSSEKKAEIYWRLSRAEYYAAEAEKRKKDNKAAVIQGNKRGIAYAGEALKLDRQSVMALFWRASNLASWAQEDANLAALGKVAQARDDVIQVLALQPDWADAYYLLGLLYASVPGWPISFGNMDFGISLMRRAVDTIGGRKEILRGYISMAAALWQRNWDSRTRNSRRQWMAREYGRKSNPCDKYCFYEGVVDYSQIYEYAYKPLESMGDREEALALLSYAEKSINRIIPSQAEQAALRHSAQRAREKHKIK